MNRETTFPNMVMNLKGTLMEHDTPILDLEFKGGKLIHKKEYTENAFYYDDLWTAGNVSEQQLQRFFTYRTPVFTRESVQRCLKAQGVFPGDIDGYIRLTHGTWGDDHFWVKFDGDTVTWKNVKIRD